MDALFGLLFLLYMAAVVIAAVSKGRQGKTRGAGAPWPRVPPLQAPGTGAGVPEGPAVGPVTPTAQQDVRIEPDRALEPGPEPGTAGGPVAAYPGHRRPAETGRGRDARRPMSEEWLSEEGLSLEWAEAGAWTGEGPRRWPASSRRRAVASPEGREGRRRDLPRARDAAELIGDFNQADLMRAVVLAEVLGPPRALRRSIRL
ncbi:MAG: hypothetical protein QME92_11360 [Bacillota bacterium]|nr:hypothetical protein [Bacillota bacterium]